MWERFSRFRRPRNVTTIRENAVQWLIDHPGEFTVNRLAVDLGLERRQALNALHGLKRTGLGAQLQHRGSGVTPPPRWLVEVCDGGGGLGLCRLATES